MNKPVSAHDSEQVRKSSKTTGKRSIAIYPHGGFPADTYNPLEVASLITEDPDAIPGTPGVVLPVAEQSKNLAVEVLIWENAVAGQTIALTLDGELLLEDEDENIAWHDVLPAEAADDTFRFQLSVPVKYLDAILPGEDEEVMLGYSVRQVGSDDWIAGPARPVRIDKHAPGGSAGTLAKITFSDAIEARGYILKSDFISDVLEATVQGYTDQRKYDEIAVKITDGTNTSPPAMAKVISSGDATVVQLPLTAFDTLEDEVLITTSYVVTDRPGNPSFESVPHNTLKLLLKDIPVALDKLEVPKFGDNELKPRLLLDKHARAGILVKIPGITGLHANDKIVVLWNGQPSDEHKVPFPPQSVQLMKIMLLYALTSRGPQNGPVSIGYQLWRAGTMIAETVTPNVVNVDLQLPGGPDPDPEIPGHGKLKQAVLTGKISGKVDEVAPEDFKSFEDGGGATLSIPWDDSDGNRLLLEGDRLWFVLGDEIDPVTNNFKIAYPLDPVSPGEATNDRNVERDLDPDWLDDLPSGQVPTTYLVARDFDADPDTEDNPAFPRFKDVKVTLPGDLPGGGGDLDVLEFTRLNSQGAIDRTQAKNGVPYRIALYDGAAQGHTIQIHLRADDGMVGSEGAPISAATYDLPKIELSDDNARDKVIIGTIDEEWAYKVCFGTATVEYTADNKIGTKRSSHGRVFVAIRKPSEDSCPFPEKQPRAEVCRCCGQALPRP
ncbi:hypothetical protein HU751_013510 [Pseudomonas sp. BW13M1]|uniref:Uncharacterized protein n=1 Tax=Pseudomonas peradeniyensis TaxID=2745488 RepID=A0A923G4X4_9PSED|nr:hypothetical protein [Pseudomonas peradeniyensis]MBV4505865.1 hypothetical protein [Pseudomonas peradeniyensis]